MVTVGLTLNRYDSTIQRVIFPGLTLSIFIMLAACTSAPTQGDSLPDLAFAGGSVDMVGYNGGCVEQIGPMETTICIRNNGEPDLRDIAVQIDDEKLTIEMLSPGEETCLTVGGARSKVTIDPANAITESNEENNSTLFPRPTPPVICTATPE